MSLFIFTHFKYQYTVLSHTVVTDHLCFEHALGVEKGPFKMGPLILLLRSVNHDDHHFDQIATHPSRGFFF